MIKRTGLADQSEQVRWAIALTKSGFSDEELRRHPCSTSRGAWAAKVACDSAGNDISPSLCLCEANDPPERPCGIPGSQLLRHPLLWGIVGVRVQGCGGVGGGGQIDDSAACCISLWYKSVMFNIKHV